MRKIEAAQEMLSRPVRIECAVKVSLAMVGICAGLAAAHAMSPKSMPAHEPVATRESIKPIILSVDWQEQNTGASKLAQSASQIKNARL